MFPLLPSVRSQALTEDGDVSKVLWCLCHLAQPCGFPIYRLTMLDLDPEDPKIRINLSPLHIKAAER